jgi:peptidoglycan hydrolase-like protein with peptidoglycan-binding domain
MTSLKFIDAISLANAQKAGHADGTAFYLAGGNAFRAWPLNEVKGIQTRFRLPIFVRSNPDLAGLPGDIEMVLHGLGLVGAPKGTLVCLDSETSVDPTYVRGLWAGIHAAGYKLIDYGSQSFVFGNQNPDGYYWGAEWTGTPHIHKGDGATQFVSFANFDVSEFSPALPLWDTARPPAPSHVTFVPVSFGPLPEITLGMSDSQLPHWYIRGRVQPILNSTWHMGLAVDGIYGPRTQAAIEQLQAMYSLPASEKGTIGPATWALLLAGTR